MSDTMPHQAPADTPTPLSPEAVRQLLDQTRAEHGPWTAHDILVGHGQRTGGPERSDARLRRVLTSIEDLQPKPIAELRILDLGALEGLFAIELARLGAEVVVVEARAANAARCRAATVALGLQHRVTVLEEDVCAVSAATHGHFDVVLCLGILYHLDQPAVFRFIETLGDVCDGVLVLDTHVALTDDEHARLADPARVTDPTRWLSGPLTVHDRFGVPRRGRTFFEHAEGATLEQRLQSPWASVQHQSFWLERSTLLELLTEAGFDALYTPVTPDVDDAADRVWLVASRRGTREATTSARRLRQVYRPSVARDPPLPTPVPAVPGTALPDIVCFGIIPWSGRWQRPQQVLTRFARRGHRVFLVGFDTPLESIGDGPRYAVEEVAERVWEVRPAVSPPFTLSERAPAPGQVAELLRALRDLVEDHGIGADAVAMVQLATWAAIALAARDAHGWVVAYDCMDEWDGFPGIAAAVVEAEQTLIAAADAVTVTALPLWERMTGHSGNVALVRNGGDNGHYAEPGEERPLAGLPHPIIGFVGGIAPWMDIALVARAARSRPDWTFALIGDQVTDLEALRGLPNVHLEPRRPYELMPSYVRDFDVCLIPFHVDHVTHAVDPVKVYEYFALGKPVVSRPMPELWRFGDLVHVALEPEDFVPAIESALSEQDPALAQRRRDVAAEADWERRLDTMTAAIARGRVRGYDRVRTWVLGQHLRGLRQVVVVGEDTVTADLVRLAPELLIPEAAGPPDPGGVLALSLTPDVLRRARTLAESHGLGSVHVLTGARGDEVPGGHRDLADACAAALAHQGLAVVDVLRLLWTDPASGDPAAHLATVSERVDARTRELLLRVAPATAPATLGALQEQIRHLRRQVDALVHGG